MATLYTERDIQKALRELRIAPTDGKVDGREAAKILTWRAKQEFDVEVEYDATTIRQHVRKGNFPEGSIDHPNDRQNLYQVQAVFMLPISPLRSSSRKGKIDE